jgi:hypothetical protein
VPAFADLPFPLLALVQTRRPASACIQTGQKTTRPDTTSLADEDASARCARPQSASSKSPSIGAFVRCCWFLSLKPYLYDAPATTRRRGPPTTALASASARPNQDAGVPSEASSGLHHKGQTASPRSPPRRQNDGASKPQGQRLTWRGRCSTLVFSRDGTLNGWLCGEAGVRGC